MHSLKATVFVLLLSAAACDGGGQPHGAKRSEETGAGAGPQPAPKSRRLRVPHYSLYDRSLVLAEWPLAFTGLPADTHAYNPSLLEHRGRLITVVRLETTFGLHGVRLANRLAATTLDAQGRQLQPLTLLQTPHTPGELYTAEDARLIAHGGAIYVVYNMATNARADGPHRVHLARLEVTDANADADADADPDPDPDADVGVDDSSGHSGGPSRAAWSFRLVDDRQLEYQHPDTQVSPHIEKNWSPFVSAGSLCFLYRSNPIVSVCLSAAQLASQAPMLRPTLAGEGNRTAPWSYGEVRGGTPATYVPELDRYVTFFHSHAVRQIGTTSSRRHYFTGFYSFFPAGAAATAFEIDSIAQEPVYTPYWLADVNPAPYHIAFASGVVWRDTHVLISYGRNDQTSAVMALDRGELLRRLGHVAPGAR